MTLVMVDTPSIGSGKYYVGDCVPIMRTFPARMFSATFFSPPFQDKRLYPPLNFKLKGQNWVDWMIPVVIESARVTDGIVFVNMSSGVENHSYVPAVEWLVSDLTRNCGLVCAQSPYAWLKMEDRDDARPNGQPGSGGKRYHRRDWEPIYCFALPDRLPVKWSDNEAFGAPPLATSFGGEFSNRDAEGIRANARKPKKPRTIFRPDGITKGAHDRDICKIANAGNIIRAPVGGGKLGHPLAHETDAPFPLALAERFVRWFVPPDGKILDPMAGSGTTAQAAEENGREWVCIDVRESQRDLTKRRFETVKKGNR